MALQLRLDDRLDGISDGLLYVLIEEEHVGVGEHFEEWLICKEANDVKVYLLKLVNDKGGQGGIGIARRIGLHVKVHAHSAGGHHHLQLRVDVRAVNGHQSGGLDALLIAEGHLCGEGAIALGATAHHCIAHSVNTAEAADDGGVYLDVALQVNRVQVADVPAEVRLVDRVDVKGVEVLVRLQSGHHLVDEAIARGRVAESCRKVSVISRVF